MKHSWNWSITSRITQISTRISSKTKCAWNLWMGWVCMVPHTSLRCLCITSSTQSASWLATDRPQEEQPSWPPCLTLQGWRLSLLGATSRVLCHPWGISRNRVRDMFWWTSLAAFTSSSTTVLLGQIWDVWPSKRFSCKLPDNLHDVLQWTQAWWCHTNDQGDRAVWGLLCSLAPRRSRTLREAMVPG